MKKSKVTEDRRKFAARLELAMAHRGIGRHELEKLAGLGTENSGAFKGNGTVTRFLKAERMPKIVVAQAMATALGVEPMWLIAGEGAPPSFASPAQVASSTASVPRSSWPGWKEAEKQALAAKTPWNWAIIGASELKTSEPPPPELTGWLVLHYAEIFARRCHDGAERQRLNELALALAPPTGIALVPSIRRKSLEPK